MFRKVKNSISLLDLSFRPRKDRETDRPLKYPHSFSLIPKVRTKHETENIPLGYTRTVPFLTWVGIYNKITLLVCLFVYLNKQSLSRCNIASLKITCALLHVFLKNFLCLLQTTTFRIPNPTNHFRFLGLLLDDLHNKENANFLLAHSFK